MPLPQGYLPRKGDELLIRVKVRSDYHDDGSEIVSAAVSGSEHRHLFVNLDKIHSLFCRAWNEGDKVQNSEGFGEVVATYDDQVWVKMLGHSRSVPVFGMMYTFNANKLEPYVAPAMADLGTDGPMAIEPETPAKYGMQVPPPAPGSQAVVEDDDDIKF